MWPVLLALGRTEYAIPAVVALATVGIGVFTTDQPLGQFFVSAVVTGFVVHFVFLGLGLTPAPSSVQITEVSIEINHKLVLNVLATGLFGFLYWLHRAEPSDEGSGHGDHAHAAD